MDEKRKGTKKTIADELLEDNFFKPPIEDVFGESKPGKEEGQEAGKDPAAKEESLLFDDFLKSPDEAKLETLRESSSGGGMSGLQQPLSSIVQPPAPAKAVVVASNAETSSSKMKIVVISLGSVIVLLAAGLVYLYSHHVRETNSIAAAGAQTVVMKRSTAPAVQPHPAASRQAAQTAQNAGGTGNVQQQHEAQQPAAPAKVQVAEAVPPAPAPVVSQQFQVVLERIKSKAAVENAKRTGLKIDKSLKFDVVAKKSDSTQYTLFVNKVYPSQGEATADNLKLMVANISNASVVKADGGYRILVGKYGSRGRAASAEKNVKSAGLQGLIKTVTTGSSTYNIKVYPFPSEKEAKAYMARVRRVAAKATFGKMK